MKNMKEIIVDDLFNEDQMESTVTLDVLNSYYRTNIARSKGKIETLKEQLESCDVIGDSKMIFELISEIEKEKAMITAMTNTLVGVSLFRKEIKS